MDYQKIIILLTLTDMVGTVFVWLYTRSENRKRATAEQIEKLEGKHDKAIEKLDDKVLVKLTAKCERIAALEKQIAAVPTQAEIIRIHERIDELNEGTKTTHLLIGELSGQIKQMNEGKKT